MGKSMTREQREKLKPTKRSRSRETELYYAEPRREQQKYKAVKKWKPHSEIEID